MDWEGLRKQFPITGWGIYLDHGSRCPTPLPVLERQMSFANFCAQRGRDYAAWWNQADQLRHKLARLLNAKAGEIGYSSSTTQALNLLAQGYPWREGDNIVTAEMEFPSNVYPWLGLREKGVEVRFLKPQGCEITLDMLKAAVDGRTRMVALSHVQAANGFRLELEAFGRFCHGRGIVFCVDATQSLGAFPVDVKACHIGFLACSTYKWLMGSDGLAVYYCSEELLPRLGQVFYGWSGREDRNEFYSYPMTYPMEARRFELGNFNFSAIAALDAAMDFHEQLTGEAITARTMEITACFQEAAQSVDGVRVIGDFAGSRRGALITLAVLEPARIHGELARRRIAVALRRDGIRIAPYFYSSPQEAEAFAQALGELMGGVRA